MKADGQLPHGARIVQEMLDAETRPVPVALRDTARRRPRGDRHHASPLHQSPSPRARGRAGLVEGVADGLPGGTDTGSRRLHRLRDRRLSSSSSASPRPDPGVPQQLSPPGDPAADAGRSRRELRCPFHGFTWNLDGTFDGIPCPWDFPHVDPAASASPRPRSVLGGLRLRQSRHLRRAARPATSRSSRPFRPWPLEDRYLTAHIVRVLPCNWKVALEAFIESYHTVAVHPQLLRTSR